MAGEIVRMFGMAFAPSLSILEERRMRASIIALGFALAAASGLAGCGKNDNNASTSSNAPAATTAPATPAPAPAAPAPAPAATAPATTAPAAPAPATTTPAAPSSGGTGSTTGGTT